MSNAPETQDALCNADTLASLRAVLERMDVKENTFTGRFPIYCGFKDGLEESPCSEPLEPMCPIERHQHRRATDKRFDVELAVNMAAPGLALAEAISTNPAVTLAHHYVEGCCKSKPVSPLHSMWANETRAALDTFMAAAARAVAK